MERKNLQQLLASAQQELNRLKTAEKALTRKGKTHRKIVLGGEVAKYLGLDIDQDILVGFLMTFASADKTDFECYISNGARARQLENLKKEQKNKNYIKKRNPGKHGGEVRKEKSNQSGQSETVKEDDSKGTLTLQYNNFSSMLEQRLGRKKNNNE